VANDVDGGGRGGGGAMAKVEDSAAGESGRIS
jgi:hypothetical protein